MKKKCLLLVWVLILCGIAKPATINFDYWPDGSPISAPTEAPYLSITDEFAEWGIIFESTTKIMQRQDLGNFDSVPNSLSPDRTEDNITLDAHFIDPCNPNIDGTVTWVSFFQDRGAQSGGGTFIAYDLGGNEVINESFNTSGKTFHTFDDWGYVGEIHRIYIGECRDALDDFTFGEITPVPEPPCWTEQDKLLSSDGFGGACFGMSVSISGDYAIAGASWGNGNVGHSGSAYIFKHSDIPDDPNWYQQVELIASDGAYYDYFGDTVSISGDYAIVGATADDDNGSDTGSAYIFKRDGTSWIEQVKLLASDAAAGDRFGMCVSISGGYAVVGAFCDDDNGADSGSAYIFNRSDIPDDPNWYQQAKLLASDGAAGDYFGLSVSISGDYAIVGGAYADDDNGSDSGSAYMFKRSDIPDDPNWYQQAKLTASDGAAGDLFGRVVSISADYCIVGAYCDDDNGTSSGSAYIFKRSALPDDPNWYQQAKLIASDGAAGDGFGQGVSISSNYAIVGAYGDDDNGDSSGSAYIFKRSGTSWIQVDKLTASDGISRDLFGLSVSISGDYTIAGAYHYYPSPYPGSAYIFKNICNEAPDANAGEHQTCDTGPDGTAQVTLDGSDSNDSDGDELTYRWLIDGNEVATGANPTIELPCGTYTIELIVNDGVEDSEPDEVVITVQDGTPPTIVCPNDVTLECPADTSVSANGSATATDNCDEGPTITYSDLSYGTCPRTIERTWTATDATGNSSTCVQTITVVDTTPPVIELVGDANVTVECHIGSYTELGATASDECDTALILVIIGGDVVDVDTPGAYVVTYDAVDACGNTATQVTRTVNVVDTTAPLVTIGDMVQLWPPNHKYREFNLSDLVVSVDDACGGSLDVDAVATIISIYSDEPEDAKGNGDGKTTDDIVILEPSSFKVRSERQGKGNGRVYGITFQVVDQAGNITVGTCYIGVPHDNSGDAPTDDGHEAGYTVP